MATARAPATGQGTAVVGAADHAGWAVLITVAREARLAPWLEARLPARLPARLIDRRRVALLDGDLPKLPHHHEAQGLAPREGVALVERVRSSAERCARAALDALAAAVPVKIAGIALRRCPPLPATVAERIASYRAQNVADSVMYREALAGAARARGWFVAWYDAKQVLADAATALGRATIEDDLKETGAALGPPWQKDHRTAMAAAIAALARKG
jgi:hypothetical protein